MQVCEAHDRKGYTQPAHASFYIPAWIGGLLSPLSYPSSWTHGSYMQRHTLIYAAPHPLQPHSQADVPCYNVQARAQGLHIHTAFHQHMHVHTSSPHLTPFPSTLLQQLLATPYHPPPHPSMPSAALTQVLTSLHLL